MFLNRHGLPRKIIGIKNLRGWHGARRAEGAFSRRVPLFSGLTEPLKAENPAGGSARRSYPLGASHHRGWWRALAVDVHPAGRARKSAAFGFRRQGSDPRRAGIWRVLRRNEPDRRRPAVGQRHHARTLRVHGGQQRGLQGHAGAKLPRSPWRSCAACGNACAKPTRRSKPSPCRSMCTDAWRVLLDFSEVVGSERIVKVAAAPRSPR